MNSLNIVKFMVLTWIIFSHSLSGAATPGHPDNDVVVRVLRETFRSGVVSPSESDLVGLISSCKTFRAHGNNDVGKSYDNLRFTYKSPGFFVLAVGTFELGFYEQTTEGLRDDGNWRLDGAGKFSPEYVRLDAATGNLIFERSTVDATGGRPESIAEPGLFAEYYMICYKRKFF